VNHLITGEVIDPADNHSGLRCMQYTDSPSAPPSPSNKRKGHPRIVLLAIALLGLGSFAFYKQQGTTPQSGPGGGRGAAAQRGTTVTVATVQTGDIGNYINALGYVTPVYTVTVRSRVDGELLSVKYREGEFVQEGDVLAQIDPRLFQAQLLQTEGQYERDKAALDQAYIDLARYKEAYARNAIPKQTLDIQQATVHQDEGTLKIDEAQIQTAKVNLQYCTIKSPITGRVGLRLVDPGNIVHAADANGIVVVTKLQPITVVFSVAEDQLGQIQKQLGHGRHLAVDALDRTQQTTLASGTVSIFDNQIDATTGTVRFRAMFSNQNNALFPNQFVNAHLLVDTQHGVNLVPSAAIQRNGDSAYVYVVNPDQTVKMRPVTVGTSNEDVTAVDGVNPGEVVVTDGFDKLQDAAKVIVQKNNGKGKGDDQGDQQDGQKDNQQNSAPDNSKQEPGKQGGQSGGQQGGGPKPGGQN
jgi:multidrug efflux system membrane fusion protein